MFNFQAAGVTFSKKKCERSYDHLNVRLLIGRCFSSELISDLENKPNKNHFPIVNTNP